MDIHDVIDRLDSGVSDEIVESLLTAAQDVTAKIADALSRVDRRVSRELIYDSVGLVAVTRTQLAVAWGRQILDDDTFKKLDDKYAELSQNLQQFK